MRGKSFGEISTNSSNWNAALLLSKAAQAHSKLRLWEPLF